MLKWLSGILTTVRSGWILHDRLFHRLRSWSWHFLNSDISRCSVVAQLRCGEIVSQGFVANLLVNLKVKEVWKSVNIWRSYGQYCSVLFFLTHSVEGTPTIPPSCIRVRGLVWECGEGQTETQTNRYTESQTAVITVHFASSTTHAKCNKFNINYVTKNPH